MRPLVESIAKSRGFNLLEMFNPYFKGEFREDDFKWIADWGFDFVRIPISYWLWADHEDPSKINWDMLDNVDRAIYLGEKYRIHVTLNFHRAPGYCSNVKPPEQMNLWKDQRASELFCYHWEIFATRYKTISPEIVSFNLINEPPPVSDSMSKDDHARVIRDAVKTIRNISPGRILIIDGINYGTVPCPELSDLEVIQSCRAYIPHGISHYKADWMPVAKWPDPKWPGGAHDDGVLWDRSSLEQYFNQWGALVKNGIPAICGEGGAYKHTPHGVFLAWYNDVLDILKNNGIGHALWNFRGPFGILDSKRTDVEYEDWFGHNLDRKLLTLLQSY